MITIVMVATVLLRWSITTGLQCDELLFLRAIELGPIGGLTAQGSSHPPLFRWILGAMFSAELADWQLRLPSLVCSLLTIVVWYNILVRLFADARLVIFSLPLMACSCSWLEIGYQLAPYAYLTLLSSLHGLMWFVLIDDLERGKPTRWHLLGFIVSGVAPFWTHFYGIHILLTDQVVWLMLVLRYRSWWRTWLLTSGIMVLMAIPVLFIAWFYLKLESGMSIIRIAHFPSYFFKHSGWLFSRMTLNLGFAGAGPIVLWYTVIVFVLGRWWMKRLPRNLVTSRDQASTRDGYLIVLCGFFLAGFVAMQSHSVLTQKCMWERYAVLGSWVHWPLMFAFLESVGKGLGSVRSTRWIAATSFAVSLLALVFVNRFDQNLTFDHQPAIDILASNAKEGDAFFAQDMDIWIGDANFDRLWFNRYSPVKLPVITGQAMTRFALKDKGLDFNSASKPIRRIWVYSDLYQADELQRMANEAWELTHLTPKPALRPIALFTRRDLDSDYEDNDLEIQNLQQ